MTGFVFSSRFNHPYYQGGGSSILAPTITEVALGGHAYMIDWKSEIPLRHQSIPMMRQQQDVSDSPGEQSINNEGLWRRFGESWHMGAGQEKYDRKESNPFRFNRSQGVNIWDKWRLSLLPTTILIDADAATNQRLAVAGSYLYYTQGGFLKYTDSLANPPTTVTGTPATDASTITSNGNRIWTSHGTDGVYMTIRNTAATVSHITGTVNLIDYVKNRVMAANGPNLYDLTALAVGTAGVLPAPYFTHGNSDWNWVGFGDSQGFIYAAGYSGDKSLIYSISITTDGTALAPPVVAGTLPDGEIVASVYGYLGRFLALGTNKGFRLALVSEGGGLNIGALIETPEQVRCFEGQGPHIWYGLSNFDAITTLDATGLGRIATNQFTDLDAFTPAYASDIMLEEETAAITSIVTFQDRRVFAVEGLGIYAEHDTDLVALAALDTGAISYGMTELKTALFIDLQVDVNDTTDADISVSMSVDGSDFNSIGTYKANQLQTFNAGESVGSEFELRLVFGADGIDPTIAPSILTWLLRSQPRPLVTNLIFVTVILSPVVENLVDGNIDYDTAAELGYIEGLNLAKSIVTFQHSNRLYSVVVEDFEVNVFALINETDGMTGFNSSCALKLKRV